MDSDMPFLLQIVLDLFTSYNDSTASDPKLLEKYQTLEVSAIFRCID